MTDTLWKSMTWRQTRDDAGLPRHETVEEARVLTDLIPMDGATEEVVDDTKPGS